MNDLFDVVKSEALKKNKANAKFMTPALVFKNENILDSYETNEETVLEISPRAKETSSSLRNYVDEVDKIKQQINEINKNVENISNLKNKINLSITTEEENELSFQLNDLIQNTNSKIQLIKTEIKGLRAKYVQRSKEHSKLKRVIHLNLTNIFKKSLQSYQYVQNLYHLSMKDKIARHIKIIYPNYNDDEVNELLNNDEVNTQALVKWKMAGHEDLKNALADVEWKYKDVKILEKSVQDLHQTIIELAALIEMNDEVIENIQENIKDAQDFTEKANIDLIEAKKIQSKTSKWTCYITIAITVAIVLVALPIVLKFI